MKLPTATHVEYVCDNCNNWFSTKFHNSEQTTCANCGHIARIDSQKKHKYCESLNCTCLNDHYILFEYKNALLTKQLCGCCTAALEKDNDAIIYYSWLPKYGPLRPMGIGCKHSWKRGFIKDVYKDHLKSNDNLSTHDPEPANYSLETSLEH